MKIILGILIGSSTSPANAPDWLMRGFEQAEVTQGDGNGTGDFQQGFSMTFRADRGQAASSEFTILKSSLLNPGNRVILTMTLNAVPHVLFDGIIGHRQLMGGDSQRDPQIKIMGKDISIMMDLEDKDTNHPGLGDKEIVSQILASYASYGITPQVSTPDKTWTPDQQERVAKQIVTDRIYVQEMAQRHSFIFRIKPGPSPRQSVGYWGPLEYSESSQKALTVNSGTATNVESLDFSEDALAATEVFGKVIPAGSKEATTINITSGSDKTSLASQAEISKSSAFVRKIRLILSSANATEAQSIAQGVTDRSAEQALTADGVLDVFRYGELLTAPGKVAVRGAGTSYDGEYYIRTATHTITHGEYKVRFRLTREGVGSTLQKVSPP